MKYPPRSIDMLCNLLLEYLIVGTYSMSALLSLRSLRLDAMSNT